MPRAHREVAARCVLDDDLFWAMRPGDEAIVERLRLGANVVRNGEPEAGPPIAIGAGEQAAEGAEGDLDGAGGNEDLRPDKLYFSAVRSFREDV